MSMSIKQLSFQEGDEIFYDPGFCNYLEGYMKYIRDSEIERIIHTDPHDNYVYEGDLFGLLDSEGIERKFHWIVMRVNDITDPSNLNLTDRAIKIPNFGRIKTLSQFYKMLRKK